MYSYCLQQVVHKFTPSDELARDGAVVHSAWAWYPCSQLACRRSGHSMSSWGLLPAKDIISV